MKLYVSNDSNIETEIIKYLEVFNVVSDIKEADNVLILPGGLGNFYDLFESIKLKKKVLVYNKDLYYSSLFKNLFQGYEKGYIEVAPYEFITIESDFNNIIKNLEDLK